MEACIGAHHLSRKLKALGHGTRLMPAKNVHPYSKGHAAANRIAKPTVPTNFRGLGALWP